MTKYIITFISTLAIFGFTTAQAETIKIGAASPDGEYAQIIVPAINSALLEYGYSAIAETSEGTQDDINKVISGEIVAALTQLDVAALNMTPERDPNENLLLLWSRIAPKALFCVAHKGGKVATYGDLTDEEHKSPLKISVGAEQGGTALTFQYLMKLDPKLQNIKFYNKGQTQVELNRLLSGRRDLVCFLAIPDPENEMISGIMTHDELFFINIDNPAFDQAKIGTNRIYDVVEVPVTAGFLGFNQETVKTIITWVGMVTNENEIDEKLLNILSTVVMKSDLIPSNTIMAKTKRLFDKAMNRVDDWMN
ncbi:MAG: hypothetical protein KAI17_06510 [Thiotrichaceae bacterium]|nr:hypothetical protein [Thiotrichaceae bacterium]